MELWWAGLALNFLLSALIWLFDWLSSVYISYISDHWFVVLVLVSPAHLLPAFE